MKNNKLRFWSYLVVVILLYGGFLTYFCMAKPSEPNNIVIEQEKTTEKTTNTAKIVGPEFYLSEITSFYECVITILFGIIGILLVISFAYVYVVSKREAQEMVIEALSDRPFRRELDDLVKSGFLELKNKGDIPDILNELEKIEERITDDSEKTNKRLELLENVMTKNSYNSPTDQSLKEKTNGDN